MAMETSKKRRALRVSRQRAKILSAAKDDNRGNRQTLGFAQGDRVGAKDERGAGDSLFGWDIFINFLGRECCMARIKLAYIGGGSTRAAGTMASFIQQGENFNGSEVVLVDLNEERLGI